MIDIDGQFSNSKTVAVRIAYNFSNAMVYPNPTKEKLTIKLQQAFASASRLKITDISGRTVLQQNIAAGEKNINLQVNHLPAGRYFIQLNNSSNLVNQSFVIIK